tara:strand:- start:1399 stop:1911 length:513 start_codon:yes stop_codon:yes gene_type:complete
MQRNFKLEEWYVKPHHKIADNIVDLGDAQNWGTSVKAAVSEWQLQDHPMFEELLQQLYALYPNHKVKELWGCTYRQGDFAQCHCHPGFDYSFAWYLDTCVHCTPLVFPDPEHPWMPPLQVVRPKVGNLYVFGGDAPHYVPPHTCLHERVVVSGNLVSVDKEAQWEPGYYQ